MPIAGKSNSLFSVQRTSGRCGFRRSTQSLIFRLSPEQSRIFPLPCLFFRIPADVLVFFKRIIMQSGCNVRVLAQAKILPLAYGSAWLRTSDVLSGNHHLPEDGLTTSGAQNLFFFFSRARCTCGEFIRYEKEIPWGRARRFLGALTSPKIQYEQLVQSIASNVTESQNVRAWKGPLWVI